MLDAPIASCTECPLGGSGGCAFIARRVPAGTQLWLQGEVPAELVLVKSGLLAMSATDSAGQELGAAVRGPRSLLGFESLRGQQARASVEALTDTVVCTSARLPASASALLQLTVDELLRAGRDGDLRSGSAVSRVARFVLDSGSLIASGQHAPFSKRHVAALLGLRPETMSRCLRALKNAGVIASDRDVRILDEPRLRELARGAPLH